MTSTGATGPSERVLLVLLSAVQLVNALDYLMVLPLGPDFARALHIPLAQLGLVGGAYMVAAALVGAVGARFLDRFDRRSALVASLLGLALATAAGGCAIGLRTLLASRLLAGALGGPAVALTLSIVADVVPLERRGAAVGTVRSAFSIASVVGVPTGLWLAQLGSWRTPFFTVAALGAILAAILAVTLAPLRGHLDPTLRRDAPAAVTPLWRRESALFAWVTIGLMTMSSFALIPYLAAYLQFNLGYPRDHFSRLYMIGGSILFVATRLFGWLGDRLGEVVLTGAAILCLQGVLVVGFVAPLPSLGGMAIFYALNLALTGASVPMSSLTTKVPLPWERARFLSIQSSVQFAAAAAGALLASRLVHAASESSPLTGIPTVAVTSMALSALVPFTLWRVARRLPSSRRS